MSIYYTLENPNKYDTSLNDNFGYSTAIDGNNMIVGANKEDDATGADSGKVYIFNTITGNLTRVLDNPNGYDTSAGDNFGCSVSISGNYAIVGAYQEDDAGGTDSGKAYIFNVETGDLVWTLNNPNGYDTSAGDNFGISVSISGNYAIVGANEEDDAGGLNSGKAYIFNVTTGALVWTLNNTNGYDTSAGDNFGISVSINNNRAIVGANQEDDVGGLGSGKAYIFNVETGALVWTLNNPNDYDTSAGDNFGRQVSISNNYTIVSAIEEDELSGANAGKVYIFNVTTGTLKDTLDNPWSYGTVNDDRFGTALSIDGNYAVIGTYEEDDAGGTSSGKAHIYNIKTSNLFVTLDNPNAYDTSANDYFGYSVSISGNLCIVGAYQEDELGNLNSGKAYMFFLSITALKKVIDNPNVYDTSVSDTFGSAVSISGNNAIVGAYLEDEAGNLNSGKAYIFNIKTGELIHTLNNPNGYDTSAGDNFGREVSIDGNYFIVTAYEEDDAGGLGSGKAYVYDLNSGTPTIPIHTLNNPNGYDTSAGDNFGYSVSISGNYCIVGAYQEDDAGGADSGKAYIYDLNSGTPTVPIYTLDNPNAYDTSDGDRFGNSVSIDGNNAIVGATEENDAGGIVSGKAYIYDLNSGTPTVPIYTLDNPNAYGTSAIDSFANKVSISSNYCIVGAYQEDELNLESSGKAYIFNVTTGALVWTLDNPNAYATSDYDYFGISVSISDNYAIIGADQEDEAGGASGRLSSGKAYIFNVTTGALVWTLDNPNAYDTSAYDNFGRYISINISDLIVGAFQEDDAGGTSSGKAYIYKLPIAALQHTLDNPNGYDTSAGDAFGYAVSISGDYCIVGAHSEDDVGGLGSGKAYVFNIETGALVWTLDNPNGYDISAGDDFGCSVGISGNYCIVGAYQEDDAGGTISGKAYIYDLNSGTPTTPIHTLDNPNDYDTSAGDRFGYSVSIYGNNAIVGAYLEDEAGNLNSGKAYIFNVTTGALVWTLDNPNGYDTSAYDNFGKQVSINGNHAIVGAYQEDDAGGLGSGKAYIFNVSTGNLVWTLDNPNAYGTSANDSFSISVSISGDYCVVGASEENELAGTTSGKAYVFDVETGELVCTLDNPNAYGTVTTDNFGESVTISNNYCTIGAYAEDDAGGLGSGKAYIYNAKMGALVWTLDNPNAYDTSSNDYFGRTSISMYINHAIIGASTEDDAVGTSSGKAYIYKFFPFVPISIDIDSVTGLISSSAIIATILTLLGAPVLNAEQIDDDIRLTW